MRGRWNLAQGPTGGFSQPAQPPPAESFRPTGEAVHRKACLPEGGFLVAWDPVAQQARWIVPQDTQWNGGVLATASDLVFGGADQTFNAYDAKTGEKLWTDKTAAAVMAGPATYEIDGEQYIAVSVGYGGANAVIGGRFPRRPGRLYVYKVGGTVKAPEFAPFVPNPPLDLTKLTASTRRCCAWRQAVGPSGACPATSAASSRRISRARRAWRRRNCSATWCRVAR